MGDPEAVARVIGDALTAGHPRSQYRVGRDAPVIELLDSLLPNRLRDRMAQKALRS